MKPINKYLHALILVPGLLLAACAQAVANLLLPACLTVRLSRRFNCVLWEGTIGWRHPGRILAPVRQPGQTAGNQKDNHVNVALVKAALVAGLLGTSSAWAQNFNESTDAGVTIPTATVLPQGTTSVTGTIVNTTESDVDLYRFTLPAGTVFTIEVLFPDEDANLIVFNSSGQGLAGDDDDDNSCTPVTTLDGLDSCLTLTLSAGTYYFAVGDNNMAAFASEADYIADNDFIDNDNGILAGPTVETLGRVGAEGGPSDINGEGPYTVNFSQAVSGPTTPTPTPTATAIPVMPVWLLGMLGGLLILAGGRRLRRSR